MSFDQAAAFFLFAVVAVVTPGPSNTMIVATGSAWGLWRGLPWRAWLCRRYGGAAVRQRPGPRADHPLPSPCCQDSELGRRGFSIVAVLEDRQCRPRNGNDRRQARRLPRRCRFPMGDPKGWLVAVSAAGTYLQAATDSALLQSASVRRPVLRRRVARAASSGSPSAPPFTRSCATTATRASSTSSWASPSPCPSHRSSGSGLPWPHIPPVLARLARGPLVKPLELALDDGAAARGTTAWLTRAVAALEWIVGPPPAIPGAP